MNLRNVAKYALSCLAAGITVCAFGIIGALLPQNSRLWVSLIVAVAVLLAVWLAVNLICAARISGKYRSMNPRQAYEYGNRVKEQTERDYLSAERAVHASLTRAYIALSALVAAVGLIVMFVSALRAESIWLALTAIAATYILTTCYSVLFPKDYVGLPDRQYILNEGEYPTITSIVRRAAQKAGCNRSVVIAIHGDGTGIYETRSKVVLSLNPAECAMLTADELYAVFLHEFAHVVNVDTSRSRRFNLGRLRWEGAFENDFGFVVKAFTSSLVYTFEINVTLYQALSSRHHEMLADERVREAGEGGNFINATAKGEMFSLFDAVPRRELNYDCFESKAAPADFESKKLALFYEVMRTECDKWRDILSRELPANVASHPTLRQRMEVMGVSDYDVSKRETDGGYVAETKKMMERADEAARRFLADNYKEIRRSRYTERKELIDCYYAAKEKGEKLPLDRMHYCMSALYGVDNASALEIAATLLKENDGYAYAHLYRAHIYFDGYDARCVDEFRAAMNADSALSEECLECIGKFALLSGDEKLLKEYRASAPDKLGEARQEEEMRMWRPGVALCPTKLSKDVISQIEEYLLSLGGVEKVYLADFGEAHTTLVMVKFFSRVPGAECKRKMEDISAYFDMRPEKFFTAEYGASAMYALGDAKIFPFISDGKRNE